MKPTGPSRGSLAVIFLTVFIDLLGFGMVLPLLPIYADQFTTDEAGWRLGLLMASFSIMQFLCAPVWGRLSDRIGRRPVLMIGLGASALCYLLFAAATIWKSLAWLFVSRIGAGAAGATISTAQAYIADCTPKQERSRGMALIGMAFGLGFTFGPLLGFLAAPQRNADPGPWPGYAAALLSGGALLLAAFLLPESLRPDSETAARRLLDLGALRRAVRVPSIRGLLLALFLAVFCLASFETTLALLIKGGRTASQGPFQFSWGQVCLTFAYLGFTLALIQGGVVRRLAGRVRDGALAQAGAAIGILGFGCVAAAVVLGVPLLLLAALAVVTAGFSFMQPSLNGLLSRRSDPARQGVILGLGQSANSLARIVGSAVGIPMLKQHLLLPYAAGAALMAAAWALVAVAVRRGKDWEDPRTPGHGP